MRPATLYATLAFNDSPTFSNNFAFTQVLRAISGWNRSALRVQHSKAALSVTLLDNQQVISSEEDTKLTLPLHSAPA